MAGAWGLEGLNRAVDGGGGLGGVAAFMKYYVLWIEESY